MNSFHNTISASGQQLIEFEAGAKSLEEEILPFFQSGNAYAWPEVNQLLINQGKKHHEGSIKRAVTCLKNKLKLIKTTDMILSPYGKPCHRYKLAA